MKDIVIIGTILFVIIFVVVLVLGIVNRKKRNKALEEASKIVNKIMYDTKNAVLPIIIEFASTIVIDEFRDEGEDNSKVYNDIINTISDFIFNKCSSKSRELADNYKDDKMIFKYLNELLDIDVINELSLTIKDDTQLVDIFTDIYNNCFTEDIERIEAEDEELSKELAEYESAPPKDETQEQHNQSIDDYMEAHLEEKIQELNDVYDELEKTIPNTVPVRDLSALAPLIDDEVIIPPTDEEPDTLVDDGTFEVVEYLDNNITDDTLNSTDLGE